MLKEIKKGFTLAEVLIVIGIIGVVAALTLPNLNHATGDKEKVTKVKKIYAALTDAYDRAQVIYGDFDTWFDGCYDNNGQRCNEIFAKRITEFLKVSKDCGFDAGCFSDSPFVYVSGRQGDNYLSTLQNDDAYMVTLSDGISLAFIWLSPQNYIRVDIDGPNKGKNQEGNDIFCFYIWDDEDDDWGGNIVNELYPDGHPDSWTGNFSTTYVTAWVIENGNLDYLRCPEEELNWETKTSCE